MRFFCFFFLCFLLMPCFVFAENQGEPLVTLNFQEISTRAALQLLAEQSHANIIMSDDIDGHITLHLEKMPWSQALDIILATQGLDKQEINGVIYIAPSALIAARHQAVLEARQKQQDVIPLQSHWIPIHYAKAADLALMIKTKDQSVLGPRGSVMADPRTNSLFVQDTPDQLQGLNVLIQKLDTPVKQVLIEARLVNIDKNYQEELGIQWGLTGMSDVSGTLSGATALQQGTSPADIPIADRLNVNLPAGSIDGTAPASFGVALAKITDNVYLDLELSALEVEGHAQIISSPRLLTSNQQPALIQQGQEIPYEESTSSGATAVTFKEAVLSLQVTPQITPDDRVILTIQVNEDKPSQTVQVRGVPGVDTREIKTQVLVNNGQTLVLGGIYEQSDSEVIKEVPFLGDLPGIGALFRSKSVQHERRELLIFITPKIVE